MEVIKITVEANVNASVKKAWDCWTNPAQIVKWNFADDEWCCPSAKNDLRFGGKFTSRMEAKDGSFGFDFAGVYTEVKTHELISYSMEDGRKVEVHFKEENDQTTVTEIFDAENQNSVELQKAGWQAILNNFKKCAELA